MRVASWLFVIGTLLAAVGFFVPSLELRLGGASINRRTSMSIYQVAARRDEARQALAAYRASKRAKVAGSLVGALEKRTRGALRGHLGDVRDAMSTLDDIDDDDVKTAGIAIGATVATFCVLALLAAALVTVEVVRGTYRRGRLITALVLSVLMALVAVAVHVGLREVAWEANDELGATAFALRGGAYLIPIAAVAALVAGISSLVMRRSALGRK